MVDRPDTAITPIDQITATDLTHRHRFYLAILPRRMMGHIDPRPAVGTHRQPRTIEAARPGRSPFIRLAQLRLGIRDRRFHRRARWRLRLRLRLWLGFRFGFWLGLRPGFGCGRVLW